MRANGDIRHSYKGICEDCGREFSEGYVQALCAQHAQRYGHRTRYEESHSYEWDPSKPPRPLRKRDRGTGVLVTWGTNPIEVIGY
jgi:hypothetical protein